jgi:hypothetical protein
VLPVPLNTDEQGVQVHCPAAALDQRCNTHGGLTHIVTADVDAARSELALTDCVLGGHARGGDAGGRLAMYSSCPTASMKSPILVCSTAAREMQSAFATNSSCAALCDGDRCAQTRVAAANQPLLTAYHALPMSHVIQSSVRACLDQQGIQRPCCCCSTATVPSNDRQCTTKCVALLGCCSHPRWPQALSQGRCISSGIREEGERANSPMSSELRVPRASAPPASASFCFCCASTCSRLLFSL